MGQSVVSSFTHANRHPDQNSLVPAVGISAGGDFMVFLYDCRNDVLLEIVPMPWINIGRQRFNAYGIFVLWLILHHRLFSKNIGKCEWIPRAQVVDIFKKFHSLEKYKSLQSINVAFWGKKASVYTEKVNWIRPPTDPDQHHH